MKKVLYCFFYLIYSYIFVVRLSQTNIFSFMPLISLKGHFNIKFERVFYNKNNGLKTEKSLFDRN